MMNSSDLLRQADAALARGDLAAAQARAEEILAAHPGHLAAELVLAEALLGRGALADASAALEHVLRADPENTRARHALRSANNQLYETTGHLPKSLPRADAQHHLDLAGLYLQQGRYDAALREFSEAEQRGADKTLCDLGRAQTFWHQKKRQEAATVARSILSRNPEAIKAKYILADVLGNTTEGKFLHQQAVVADPSGLVARRLFGAATGEQGAREEMGGEQFEKEAPQPDAPIRPRRPEPRPNSTRAVVRASTAERAPKQNKAPEESGVTAEELAGLTRQRRHRLDEGFDEEPVVLDETDIQRAERKVIRERVKKAASAIEDIASQFQLPVLASPPVGIKPVQLLVSHQRRLREQYEEAGFLEIDGKLKELKAAIEAGNKLEAEIIYLDSRESLHPYSIDPPRLPDFDGVKKVLSRLIEVTEQGGRPVQSVLIVGGDRILPYFKVANPLFDDPDKEFYTDTPYVTRDANDLLPSYTIARLPDNIHEPSYLVTLLDHAIHRHYEENRLHMPAPEHMSSFGLSADIWGSAAEEVFSVIRNGYDLNLAPPHAGALLASLENYTPHLTYYNLHGLVDSPKWFGQRNSRYSVALQPDDIAPESSQRAVVFSEACYGAHILNKTSRESIALCYLGQGAIGFVGSTAVAYGSFETPLGSADLLAWHFWRLVKKGKTVGEAFTEAKLEFAREVMDQQGFLAGEDQKTLLSFVLLGDPSLHAVVPPESTLAGKGMAEIGESVPSTIVHREHLVRMGDIPVELIAKSKETLRKLIPDIANKTPQVAYDVSEALPQNRRSFKAYQPDNYVLAYENTVSAEEGELRYTVRVTMNPRGKVVKIAVMK